MIEDGELAEEGGLAGDGRLIEEGGPAGEGWSDALAAAADAGIWLTSGFSTCLIRR